MLLVQRLDKDWKDIDSIRLSDMSSYGYDVVPEKFLSINNSF